PSIVPYQALPAADGYLMLAVANERLWERFCSVTGLEECGADPRFRTNADRVANRDELLPLIEARLRERTRAEWIALFEAEGIPAGPVQGLDEVFRDPQVSAREMLVEVAHPT